MLVNVVVSGCDDTTEFEMEMNEQEYEFFKRLCKLSTDTSSYGCMPILQELPN